MVLGFHSLAILVKVSVLVIALMSLILVNEHVFFVLQE